MFAPVRFRFPYDCFCPPVSPVHSASVLVASAFHPSYAEKMMTCAETATDFKGCMVVRKGLEGESVQRYSSVVAAPV